MKRVRLGLAVAWNHSNCPWGGQVSDIKKHPWNCLRNDAKIARPPQEKIGYVMTVKEKSGVGAISIAGALELASVVLQRLSKSCATAGMGDHRLANVLIHKNPIHLHLLLGGQLFVFVADIDET